MSDKKQIDRLFQEKFKDFDVSPKDVVWSRISDSLPNKKKKRRAFVWWQMAGVAAAIALLFTIGLSLLDSRNSNGPLPVVDTETEETLEKPTIDDELSDKFQDDLMTNESIDKSVVGSSQDTSNKELLNTKKEPRKGLTKVEQTQVAAAASLTEPSKSVDSQEVLNKKTVEKESGLNQNSSTVVSTSYRDTKAVQNATAGAESKSESESKERESSANSSFATAANFKKNKDSTLEKTTQEAELKNKIKMQSIEEAIAEQTETKNEKEEEQNRWSIAPNVAPVYFSSLGQGSPIHNQFNGNSKGSDVSMSYGIAGSYRVAKRLKVRAGVSQVNLNQITSDVFAFTGAEAAARGVGGQMSNVKFKDGMETLSLMSSDIMNRNSTPEVFNTKIAGNLEQRFGFIEVPLELEYRLLDKKFGVNVIGGFSTLFLNENQIYADINGNSTLIGEAENINNTSFSANVGLGMDYSLSKQWNINLEPMFKYQINTFNNTTGDFRPFFIGVYTGLSFKF